MNNDGARIHDDGNDGSSVSDDTLRIRDETRRVDKAPMGRKSPWDGKVGKGSRGGESLMAASRANGMAADASVVEGTNIGDFNVVHKANRGAGTRFCRATSGDGIKQKFATHVGRARGLLPLLLKRMVSLVVMRLLTMVVVEKEGLVPLLEVVVGLVVWVVVSIFV